MTALSPQFNLPEPLEARTLLSAFEAHINFQPAQARIPKGYIADTGALFRARNGFRYGWNSVNSHVHFDRNLKRSPDQRYDTVADLQRACRPGPAGQHRCGHEPQLRWEIQVQNGLYQVHAVAGDPSEFKNILKVKAETKLIVNGSSTKKRRWLEGTAIVEVKDGRLTLSSHKGARRNRIAFIDIVQVRGPSQPLEAEGADRAKGIFNSGAAITEVDPGDSLVFENVLFDKSLRSIQTRLAAGASNAGQSIEFRLDSPTGKLIGALQTEGAGDVDNMRNQSAAISAVTGLHDLHILFKGDAEIGDIDSFRLSTRPLIRIMPIGDSVTEARGGYDSYRWGLWKMLENAGYSVDFVGPKAGVRPESGDPLHFDFDLDHASYSGLRIDQILDGHEKIPGGFTPVAQAHPTDIALIHLGTNDLFANQSVAGTVAEMRLLIERLRDANPDVIVLLAQILPTDYQGASIAEIQALNAAYAQLAAEMSTSESPVLIVDQFSNVDIESDLFDRVHPTAAAELEMASRWFDAVENVLG